MPILVIKELRLTLTKELIMTKLEKQVYDYIKENTDVDSMETVDINDLVQNLDETANVLRGVLSSLVKKNMIEVEEYEANRTVQIFYWMKGAFNN